MVSQHWIRSLAWKLSILLGYVAPGTASSGAMSVAYPVEIAADTLRGIQMFPMQAFEVHGPGMEVKMCEIATVLADSIICSPSEDALAIKYSKGAGAKAVLKCLADRIFRTQTMNPGLRDALAAKLEVALKCTDIAPGLSITLSQEPEDEHKQDGSIDYIF